MLVLVVSRKMAVVALLSPPTARNELASTVNGRGDALGGRPSRVGIVCVLGERGPIAHLMLDGNATILSR